MEQMNGEQKPTLTKDCQDVIALLEQTLASAKRGEIISIGMVLVRGQGVFTSTGTLNGLMELVIGAEDLKDAVKAHMRAQAAQAQQQRSTIIRPPPGMKVSG